MKIVFPDYVKELIETLRNAGYECWVVGGAVRSALLQIPVHDYDLTTNALPEEMKQVFSSFKVIETGIRHGTLTVLSEGHPIEITTYRKDAEYIDHRHPEEVIFTKGVEEDCARRDFTVNALCSDGDTILDFFGGQEDLQKRVIRCIRDPDKRFEEDALRILRALRFASQLGFTIEEKTAAALKSQRYLLRFISAERIRDEFTGFLENPACVPLLDDYRAVFEEFLPGITDVSSMTLCRMYTSENDPLIRLAILLDDECFAESPGSAMKRLKYTRNETRAVTEMLKHKNDPVSDRIGMRRLISVYQSDVTQYIGFRSAYNAGWMEEEMLKTYRMILADHDCTSVSSLAVNGNDLKACGLRGKEISDTLQNVLSAVMEDQLENRKEAILEYIRKTQ